MSADLADLAQQLSHGPARQVCLGRKWVHLCLDLTTTLREPTTFFPACMRLSRRFDTLSWTPSTCVVMQPGEFTVLGIEYIVPSSLGTNKSKVLRQGVGRLSHGRRTAEQLQLRCIELVAVIRSPRAATVSAV